MALALPLVASLFRLIPPLNRSRTWAWFNSIFVYPPLWGTKHRQPTAAVIGGGFVPTRGQTWYIVIVCVLNVVLLIAPQHNIQPQSTFASLREQEVSVIGNRAGVMAMGNVVALTVFAGRNNPLLALTGCNYDTYLLFHRVLGYLAIFHTVLHSVMLLAYYKLFGDYASESALPYWSWGIVATVAAVAIWPASVLAVRKRFYEIFLSTHHVLVVLFLVGYFYHIYLRYKFNWGYEIFCYVAGALWGVERLVRLVRVALAGWRTATVTEVAGSGGEYLRVDVDGVYARGLVYVYFPTLSWRFWENHPLSVMSSSAPAPAVKEAPAPDEEAAVRDKEAAASVRTAAAATTTSSDRSERGVATKPLPQARQRMTLVVRTQSGMTARLARRVAAAAGGGPLRLPVLVEGSYHAHPTLQLSQCTALLCIAGGVGLTAVLPLLREHSGPRRRLCWGLRNESLLDELAGELAALPPSVQVETRVGTRLDVEAILAEELTGGGGGGATAVVVCGPAAMADRVRAEVARLAESGRLQRGVVLADETFTW